VREVDEHVATLAAASGALVNRADAGELGELVFPAVVRRGPVQVAVSSGGVAPGLSRELARRLAEALDTTTGLDGDGLAVLVQLVEQVRVELRDEEGVTAGALDWREVLDGSILDLIHQGRRAEAKERLLACLSSS
jgi:siroheme synthase-like protein